MPRETLNFLGRFLRNPKAVGAVAPSSRYLARRMTEGIRLTDGEVLMEFGPGTGAITASIERVLPAAAAYVGIERDERFVRMLHERFPKLAFHRGLAQDAEAILAQHAPGRPVRAIVSGLPFATLPIDVQAGILKAVARVLAPGGRFRTFQYVHAYRMTAARRFRADMDAILGAHVRSKPVWRNVPPAFVLDWTKA